MLNDLLAIVIGTDIVPNTSNSEPSAPTIFPEYGSIRTSLSSGMTSVRTKESVEPESAKARTQVS